jgi:hypothetical protein
MPEADIMSVARTDSLFPPLSHDRETSDVEALSQASIREEVVRLSDGTSFAARESMSRVLLQLLNPRETFPER